jgi:hypothetical protein
VCHTSKNETKKKKKKEKEKEKKKKRKISYSLWKEGIHGKFYF